MSRFSISHLRVGPDDLRRQLPLGGETVDIRQGPDGQTYFSARLDRQLKHHIEASTDTSTFPTERLDFDDSGPFLWVSDIVMRASTPGEAPHHGMQRFPVDLAYILDLSYWDDQTVDYAKLHPVAAVDIDDLPQDATAEEAVADQGRSPALATIEDLPDDSIPEPGRDDLPANSGQTTASTAVAAPSAPPHDPLVAQDPAGEPDGVALPAGVPPVGDDRPGEQHIAADEEGESDPDPAAPTPAPALVSSPAPIAADLTGAPELVITPARTATAAEPNTGDVDTTTRAETLPATPAPSSPTVASEPPTTGTPDASEITGPIPTATTARPPAPTDVGADIASGPARLPTPPQGPPGHDHSVAAATRTPAPSPTRHSEAPTYPSSWPPAARPARPAPAPHMPPQHTAWPQIIPTTRSRRTPSTKAIAISAVILIGVILTAIAIYNVAGSDSGSGQAAAPTPVHPSDADIQRVKNAVPKGYSDTSCTARDDSAQASVKCGPNSDPGGPQTATYTLYADQQALTQAFATTIAGFDRVTCPGNIQSPVLCPTGVSKTFGEVCR
ncbi:hypothetical protein LIX17_25240 (plasmid) [Mycobacterium avium subsp. hominissuis]|uniref:hypothetical protein n=1 Tax=Mycobacterium avium TaxID=1764 RepID=UPI003140550B